MEAKFCRATGKVVLLAALILLSRFSYAQTSPPVMFYNVENLFDTYDNPDTNDDEFTPQGEKHWSQKRFKNKRNAILKTIFSVENAYGDFPYIIGLAEIENKYVLRELVENTSLSKLEYNFIHRSSDDPRGIECALLYREKLFTPVLVENVKVTVVNRKLRHILYVKGVEKVFNDTLHLFVVHFPSKLGGEAASRPWREASSEALVHKTDSIYKTFRENFPDKNIPNVIIMGDFNDTPTSIPISLILSSTMPLLNKAEEYLAESSRETIKGSIRYRGEWEMIDQFIVSAPLREGKMVVFSPDFCLESDDKYLGVKPFRTYSGPRYIGGVSDHLPILFLDKGK
jgi:endonuclease/exonuclease/phosphatase family metal-dependent hydrolase